MSLTSRIGACLLTRKCSHHIRPLIPAGQFQFYNEQVRNAGHAKWQNIRSTKQANDLAKGKLISRYVLLVRKSIVCNGMQADPKLNSQLAGILSEASKFNVPKATLERAMTRATNLKIITVNLEIQGPGGCTIIVRCETDNVTFLRRDMKKAIRKHDANLVTPDTLISMFKGQGFVRTSTKTADGREIDGDFAEEAAIMANAEEVSKESYASESSDDNLAEQWVFATDGETLSHCKTALEKQGFVVLSSEIELVPYREVDFGPQVYEKVEELQKIIRELDQVVDVYHNVAIPKE